MACHSWSNLWGGGSDICHMLYVCVCVCVIALDEIGKNQDGTTVHDIRTPQQWTWQCEWQNMLFLEIKLNCHQSEDLQGTMMDAKAATVPKLNRN